MGSSLLLPPHLSYRKQSLLPQEWLEKILCFLPSALQACTMLLSSIRNPI